MGPALRLTSPQHLWSSKLEEFEILSQTTLAPACVPIPPAPGPHVPGFRTNTEATLAHLPRSPNTGHLQERAGRRGLRDVMEAEGSFHGFPSL